MKPFPTHTFMILAMLALTGFARGDDLDPEPPGDPASLNKLMGSWVSVRRMTNGQTRDFAGIAAYKFEKDKATLTLDGKTRELTFEVDRKRPSAFQLFIPQSNTFTSYYFKISRGELYITAASPNARPDFSGTGRTVTVFKRQK